MSEETAKITSFVAGVLASIKPEDDESNLKKAAALLSKEADEIGLSASGKKELARMIIRKGFEGDVSKFVFSFWQYCNELHENQEGLSSVQHDTLDQLLSTSVSTININMCSGVGLVRLAIETAIKIKVLASESIQGLVNQLIRRCGKEIDYNIVDRYCEDHPYSYNPDDCHADEIKELLLQGVFKNLGFWRIWCMIRRFFLGKNPAEAEAEMEKEKEIGHLRGLLEGSWKHYLPVKSLDSENIIRDECAFLQRLLEIDPDYYPWLKSTHPGEKRLESTEIGRLIKKSTSDSNA